MGEGGQDEVLESPCLLPLPGEVVAFLLPDLVHGLGPIEPADRIGLDVVVRIGNAVEVEQVAGQGPVALLQVPLKADAAPVARDLFEYWHRYQLANIAVSSRDISSQSSLCRRLTASSFLRISGSAASRYSYLSFPFLR